MLPFIDSLLLEIVLYICNSNSSLRSVMEWSCLVKLSRKSCDLNRVDVPTLSAQSGKAISASSIVSAVFL